jgi:dihydrofolate reductase
MRKIIFQMMTSLDGFFEGSGRELDWHVVDQEFFHYALDLLNSVDTILFGRVTYLMMAEYWLSPKTVADDPVIANKMNTLPKIVFSSTLENADWANTRIVKNNVAGELMKMKEQSGQDMVIFGSSDLAVTLTKLGLIDEYRIIVNPVVLGSGKALLKGLNARLKLKLVTSRNFSSGSVLLCYRPDAEAT